MDLAILRRQNIKEAKVEKMNILYISHLSENNSQGPNYSVPAQVQSQSEEDNVFWWNLTEARQQWWLDTGLFHGIKEFPKKKIALLPKPFDRPDLVVFESFYYLDDAILSFECHQRGIPYIVVPRSALTRQAQDNKRLKKFLGNSLLFSRMTKHALAIQYLTEKEYMDSGDRWCKNHFIIPNGIAPQDSVRIIEGHTFNGVYIGRFDSYQKGLDLLLEACVMCKEELEENGVTISLYGPERFGYREIFIKKVQENSLGNILLVADGVFGDEKRKILKKADFFIMTSRFEGMPMSLIEAMSYGIPCLVTKGSNMAEIIEEHNAGWGCRTEVTDIVDAFKRMISDRDRFSEISNNAYELSKEYNWDKIARETHDIYEKLLSR